MSGWLWVVVGVAAALGAQLRYAADLAVQRARLARARRRGTSPLEPGVFPWGTLAVNLVGSALLAGVGRAVLSGADDTWRIILGTGLAGGLTTFSTWTFETVGLWRGGRRWLAVINVALNLVLGLGAVWLMFVGA